MIGSRVAPEPCDISSYLDWVLKMMVSSPAINIFRYMNLVLGDSATMELNLTEIILEIFKQKGMDVILRMKFCNVILCCSFLILSYLFMQITYAGLNVLIQKN